MLHLDNPEKYQYPRSELQSYGGVDIDDLLRPSSSDRYKAISEMCDFIIENDIREYRDLFDYARQNEFDTWFPALCDNCSFMAEPFCYLVGFFFAFITVALIKRIINIS